MVILTEIDDIHRFANQEKFRSYVGLTPTSHAPVVIKTHMVR